MTVEEAEAALAAAREAEAGTASVSVSDPWAGRCGQVDRNTGRRCRLRAPVDKVAHAADHDFVGDDQIDAGPPHPQGDTARFAESYTR